MTNTNTTIDNTTRARVTEIISAGLVAGLGTPLPGQLCLEAAICLALGEPHGDAPTCVAAPDRAFAIRLQDAYPSTPAERAAVFLPLGLAQLGTAGTDRAPWLKLVAEGTIRRVLPMRLRMAAEKQTTSGRVHAIALNAAANRCAAEGTVESALSANMIARAAADAAAYAASASASACADNANDAAYVAAADYADAAAYAADYAYAAAYAASTYAAACADNAAYADNANGANDAAYAYADYADYASTYAERRQLIELSVSIALEAYAAEGRS